MKESIPQGALSDLIWCMYFSDDWDDERGKWDSFYVKKKEGPKDGIAQHQKHGQLEDAYTK